MLIGKNHLQLGDFWLTRVSSRWEDEQEIAEFFKASGARTPFLDPLNKTTLFLRIPSFGPGAKKDIDSVLAANRSRILSTENLIIDITSGTGGNDESFEKILPIIYTNPIRTVGTEFLSTPLNNSRMIDIINNPKWGVSEEGKKWAKAGYEKLNAHLGQFVNLDSTGVTIDKFDTVYPYPKNVGIIMNEHNGSADEQFLLSVKQSRKVKLFGSTTMGALDMSNMYYVPNPCHEFELGYCLSRSMRIPGMAIDGMGIQPDYYIDRSIPRYKWITFVSDVLNGK